MYFTDDLREFSLRLKYQKYLGNKSNTPINFEDWKERFFINKNEERTK